jgi:hypothetical protein
MSKRNGKRSGYQVRITFRGLCPFVPGADLNQREQPEWVGAFLVNARNGSREEFPGIPAELPDHFPFLEYRASDLKGMANAPAETVLSPLRNVDVGFVPPAGSAEELRVDLANRELDVVPTSKEEGNVFDWVTPMDGVMLGSGEVAGECFDGDPSRRLAARVHITRGLLQTDQLGLIGKKAAVAPLQINGVVKRRASAKSVALTIDCAPGNFKIRLQPFDPPGALLTELVFREPPRGEILEIGISNLCADDLLSNGQSAAGPAALTRADADFRWNYLVSKKDKDLLPQAGVPGPFEEFPFPASFAVPEDGGGGGLGVQCSPPQTAPVSGESLSTMQTAASRVGG